MAEKARSTGSWPSYAWRGCAAGACGGARPVGPGRCAATRAALSSGASTGPAAARQPRPAIAPLAERPGGWPTRGGACCMRAGNDRSLFARQVERYADLYTSRVSNLGAETPYRLPAGPPHDNLPHDPDA